MRYGEIDTLRTEVIHKGGYQDDENKAQKGCDVSKAPQMVRGQARAEIFQTLNLSTASVSAGTAYGRSQK